MAYTPLIDRILTFAVFPLVVLSPDAVYIVLCLHYFPAPEKDIQTKINCIILYNYNNAVYCCCKYSPAREIHGNSGQETEA